MHETAIAGSDIVLRVLKEQKVDLVFGYPGGAVLPIYDSLFGQNDIRHILVRQEQGAVHAAEGYARTTGRAGVVCVTSGPGATNAVTGLTDAMMDSIPIVCLTGQVATHLIGSDAFQECDTTGITRSCTKHNYLVKDVSALAGILHEAFYVATAGRPGPVVVDIPKNVQMAQTIYTKPVITEHKTYHPQTHSEDGAIEKAVMALAQAERPVIYGGGGLINSGPGAAKALREFVDLTGIPCTLTLMGLGAFPASHPDFLGMLGMHGTYEANLAMHGCDAMLCAGARFDDRVTGRLDAFSPRSVKIHIDIDPSSINKTVSADIPIIGDVGDALESMIAVWKKRRLKTKKTALARWKKQIDTWRQKDCLAFTESKKTIKPQQAIQRLFEKTRGRALRITTEVGQHQMWAAQYFHFDEPQRWITSGGLGTMGFGLPAAIGAQLAHPEDLVIDIAGDASILMNIQELSTAVQYRLPVKIFIINNQYMGMVRQWQELLHGGRLSESYTASLPDFVKLAEAYGLKGLRAETPAQLEQVIDEMIETPGAVIADIVVEKVENCFPMIPSGAAHNEMRLAGDSGPPAVSKDGMALV